MDKLEGMGRKSKKTLSMLVGILCVILFILVASIFPKDLIKFKKYFLGASSTVSITVSNSLPTISSQYLNAGGAITLIENATGSVGVTATITDNNGCEDLTQATVAVYKSGTTCASAGNADNDDCYFATVPITCSGSLSYSLNQSFNIYYYADPADYWLATIIPTDNTGDGSSYDAATVTMNYLQAINVSALDYGSLNPGAKSTGSHTTTVTNSGNVAADFYLQGTSLGCVSGCIGTIPVANQKYKLTAFEYDDSPGGTALSGDNAAAGANIAKATQASNPSTASVYWQISVPNGVKGALSGTTTFTVKNP